jgi:hypothetical protein
LPILLCLNPLDSSIFKSNGLQDKRIGQSPYF